MINIKKIMNIGMLVSLVALLNCSAMDKEKGPEETTKVPEVDFPINVQQQIVQELLKSEPELEQWLIDKKGRNYKKLQGHRDGISCLAITPDSKKVITGAWDNTAIIWGVETGKQLAKLQGHARWINCLSITADGKKVITGSADHTAIIWDIEDDQLTTALEQLSLRQLRILELAYKAAQKYKKVKLPATMKGDVETLPTLIKNLIEKHVAAEYIKIDSFQNNDDDQDLALALKMSLELIKKK